MGKDIPQEVPGKKDVQNEGLQGAAQAAWRGTDNVAQAGADGAVVGDPAQGLKFAQAWAEGSKPFNGDAHAQALTNMQAYMDPGVYEFLSASLKNPKAAEEVLKNHTTA